EHVIGRWGRHRLVAPDEGKSYLLDLVKELTGHQLDRPVQTYQGKGLVVQDLIGHQLDRPVLRNQRYPIIWVLVSAQLLEKLDPWNLQVRGTENPYLTSSALSAVVPQPLSS
ncbi:MAG: hypothetical protein N0E48_22230, partial [Candidatus Thiodiazotropha endolucinida]|nr:hypothetical protein [Candidatus Thiodiazotropha taylori]MCW4346053.1 hypothetical protein [Candidatus Thiodiazotropha endolucinida]